MPDFHKKIEKHSSYRENRIFTEKKIPYKGNAIHKT